MAEVTNTRIWKGVEVDEYTDTSSGAISLYQYGNKTTSTLLASSPSTGSIDGSTWTIDNNTLFTNLYNSENPSQSLSNDEFEQLFYNEGRQVFNDDRALVLNDELSYENVVVYENNTTQFAQVNTVPGVIDPKTHQVVTDEGKLSDYDIYGNSTSPVVESGDQYNSSTYLSANEGIRALSQEESGLVGSGVRSFATPNRGTSLRSASMLRYPEQNLTQLGFDYIQITAHDYQSGTKASTSISNIDRVGGQVGPTVQLPMLPAAESTAVDWQQDSLNEIQATFAQIAMDTMEKGSEGDIGGAFKQLIGGTTNFVTQIASDDTIKAKIKAYFAGQAVGANILTRSTGSIINPNLELLFRGPKLRQFNFNFKLRPRSASEASIVKQIIKFFKTNMAPQTGGQNLFLYTPNIFKIEYIYSGGGQHPYLNKIKPCALTNFSVNYVPDGSYMTYQDGSMTGYDIALGMNEIRPIYYEQQINAPGVGY